MKPEKLIFALITVLAAIFTAMSLTGCESIPVTASYSGPGYVLSYNPATGVAVHVSAK